MDQGLESYILDFKRQQLLSHTVKPNLSAITEGGRRPFLDKNRLVEFMTNRLVLQRLYEVILHSGEKDKHAHRLKERIATTERKLSKQKQENT